jgi:hypothetical protein
LATFKVSTVLSTWAKKLGKEEISVEITEWEMMSMLKALANWNKKIYKKIRIGVIDEAIKEGYDINIDKEFLTIECPHCKEKIEV